MKRFFSSQWAILAVAIVLGISFFNIVSLSSPVQAGSPALQKVVDDITRSCKNMNKDSDTWKSCEKKQNNLKAIADCSGQFFKKGDNSKWGYDAGKLNDCQTKINDAANVTTRTQGILDLIKNDCTDVSGPSWSLCERLQNTLVVIGCSSTMFERVGGGVTTGKKFSYKQDEVDRCQEIIKSLSTTPATNPGEGVAPEGTGSSTPGSGDAEDDIPCLGGALGFVLCPLINIAADGIRAVASFIDSMMQFRMLIGDESSGVIRSAWGNFVGVANIMLVIAFMIIIFSQSSSIGLSNYGIKKMLPKLVIAAIAINLSFYICAFAIDISNIIGNGILGLMSGQSTLDPSIREGIAKEANLEGPGSFQTIIAGALGLVIGVVLVLLFITPLLLGVIITFVILVGRQVILLLLVIVSPIAFAAWLLPNTEQFFKKWKDLFQSMLLAYPIVMLVFGAALLSANVISTTAKVSDTDSDVSNAIAGDALASIISLLVLAIPLIALPFILKSSSSMLGKLGNLAARYGGQQIAGKAGGATKGAITRAPGIRDISEIRAQRKQAKEYGRKRASADRAVTRAQRRGALLKSLPISKEAAYANQSIDNQALAAAAAIEKEDRGNERARLDATIAPQDMKSLGDALRAALDSGDQAKIGATMDRFTAEGKSGVAAMGDILGDHAAGGGFDGDANKSVRESVAKARNDNWSTIKGADPKLAGLDLSEAATGAARVRPMANVTQEQLTTMSGDRLEELASDNTNHELFASAIANPEIAKKLGDRMDDIHSGLGRTTPLTGETTQQRAQRRKDEKVAGSTAAATRQAAITQGRTVKDAEVQRWRDANATTVKNVPSDRRLKKNISMLGNYNDIPLYRFRYNWSDIEYVGTMAQDILTSHPNAVTMGSDGFYRVDYSQLGFEMTTYQEWKNT